MATALAHPWLFLAYFACRKPMCSLWYRGVSGKLRRTCSCRWGAPWATTIERGGQCGGLRGSCCVSLIPPYISLMIISLLPRGCSVSVLPLYSAPLKLSIPGFLPCFSLPVQHPSSPLILHVACLESKHATNKLALARSHPRCVRACVRACK